jgi:hypothetical protein
MSSVALSSPSLPRDLPRKITTHAAALLLLAVCVDAVNELHHAEPVGSTVVTSAPAVARMPDAHNVKSAAVPDRVMEPDRTALPRTASTIDASGAAVIDRIPTLAQVEHTAPAQSGTAVGLSGDIPNSVQVTTAPDIPDGTPNPAPSGSGRVALPALAAGGTSDEQAKQDQTESAPIRSAPAETPAPARPSTVPVEPAAVPVPPVVAAPVIATPVVMAPATPSPAVDRPSVPVPARPIVAAMPVPVPSTMGAVTVTGSMSEPVPAVPVHSPTPAMPLPGPDGMVQHAPQSMI